MKSNLNENLTKIRNFFVLIRTQYPTREEFYNFLLECKSFIFNQYGLDENKYDITIHFIVPHELGFDEAKMYAHENDKNKFDINLSFHKLSNKYSLLPSTKKENSSTQTKNQTTLSNKDLLKKRQTSILTLIISFFHELGHVFQYIRESKIMNKEDEIKNDLSDTFEQVCYLMPNSKKTRLIIKALGKHINALAYMSRCEKDADKKSYIYFASILTKLIQVEEDEEVLDFLCSIHGYINKARKHNYKIYREYSKENREAIEKLHDLKFEQELEKLTEKLKNQSDKTPAQALV